YQPPNRRSHTDRKHRGQRRGPRNSRLHRSAGGICTTATAQHTIRRKKDRAEAATSPQNCKEARPPAGTPGSAANAIWLVRQPHLVKSKRPGGNAMAVAAILSQHPRIQHETHRRYWHRSSVTLLHC